MDAQQRLLLERSMEALQASAPDQATPPARTSVIVGIGTVDYTSMSRTWASAYTLPQACRLLCWLRLVPS